MCFAMTRRRLSHDAGRGVQRYLSCVALLPRRGGMLSCFPPSLADISHALLGLVSNESKEGFVMTTVAIIRTDHMNNLMLSPTHSLLAPFSIYGRSRSSDTTANFRRVWRLRRRLCGRLPSKDQHPGEDDQK